jgi:hypothetical protein
MRRIRAAAGAARVRGARRATDVGPARWQMAAAGVRSSARPAGQGRTAYTGRRSSAMADGGGGRSVVGGRRAGRSTRRAPDGGPARWRVAVAGVRWSAKHPAGRENDVRRTAYQCDDGRRRRVCGGRRRAAERLRRSRPRRPSHIAAPGRSPMRLGAATHRPGTRPGEQPRRWSVARFRGDFRPGAQPSGGCQTHRSVSTAASTKRRTPCNSTSTSNAR